MHLALSLVPVSQNYNIIDVKTEIDKLQKYLKSLGKINKILRKGLINFQKMINKFSEKD